MVGVRGDGLRGEETVFALHKPNTDQHRWFLLHATKRASSLARPRRLRARLRAPIEVSEACLAVARPIKFLARMRRHSRPEGHLLALGQRKLLCAATLLAAFATTAAFFASAARVAATLALRGPEPVHQRAGASRSNYLEDVDEHELLMRSDARHPRAPDPWISFIRRRRPSRTSGASAGSCPAPPLEATARRLFGSSRRPGTPAASRGAPRA